MMSMAMEFVATSILVPPTHSTIPMVMVFATWKIFVLVLTTASIATAMEFQMDVIWPREQKIVTAMESSIVATWSMALLTPTGTRSLMSVKRPSSSVATPTEMVALTSQTRFDRWVISFPGRSWSV